MKCYIYKIWKNGKDEVYIGSTSNFKKRMLDHKRNCNNEKSKDYNYFIYQYIRQNEGWDEFDKEIIYECDVEDKYEKLKIEGEYIKQFEKTLNERNSFGCKNRNEYIKEYNKEYYNENKEYYKEYHKEYREENKEKINEYHKKYREENKKEINEKNNQRARQKVNCPECNKELNKGSLTRHFKSKHTKEI